MARSRPHLDANDQNPRLRVGKSAGVTMKYEWTCACCGQRFDTLPLDYGFKGPDHWFDLSLEERQSRTRKTDDICVIDGQDFFLRGVLDVPVIDLDDSFNWGVWVSLSRKSFDRAMELWDETVPDDEPPLFGWLCNRISVYPDMPPLEADVYLRNNGLRPRVELWPTDHPLAVEQRQGITRQRVEEIASIVSGHRKQTQ